MCPWILVLHHWVLPRLTVLRISTSLWALGPITLISQDSLLHYLPVRGVVPPCVTGQVVSVMSPHPPSTATSNLTGNVSFDSKVLTDLQWKHEFSFLKIAICHVNTVLFYSKTMTSVDRVWSCFPQRSQHLLIWRTMGSLMSCHLRAQSPCPGHGPCESHINYLS